jgi:hypothetical protein
VVDSSWIVYYIKGYPSYVIYILSIDSYGLLVLKMMEIVREREKKPTSTAKYLQSCKGIEYLHMCVLMEKLVLICIVAVVNFLGL